MVGLPMVSHEECPGLTAGSEVGDVGMSRPVIRSSCWGIQEKQEWGGWVAEWLGMFREESCLSELRQERHCLITGCGKGSEESCRKPRERQGSPGG